MSFLRGFYSRTPNLCASSPTVRADSFVADTIDVEERMEEDGFVVYTNKKASCQTVSASVPGGSNNLEYNYLQNSSAAQSYPTSYPASGPLQTTIYNYGSYNMGVNTSKTMPQQESKTFLTVSDIPMKLGKHLEMASTVRTTRYRNCHSKPDFRQYYYDFQLEKKTLEDYSFR